MGKQKFRPRCFFDVRIGTNEVGRIVFELFNDTCPKAAENFKKLCQGGCGLGLKSGKPLHYQGTIFHRIIKGFMIQGGDFSCGDGTGGESIYGGTFADECLTTEHDRPFLLSMANRGPNTNGSQFFITTAAAPHLNGKHMVFGHVLSGEEIVRKIEGVPISDTKNHRPIKQVVISACGELIPVKKKRTKEKTEGKEKKKHKKGKKKRERSASLESPSSEVECSVRAEEVPEVPLPKFLYRGNIEEKSSECDRSPRMNNTTSGIVMQLIKDEVQLIRRIAAVGRELIRRDRIDDRSGRKIKGRGRMCYRSPGSPNRDRSYTPPHWKQASLNTHRMNDATWLQWHEKRGTNSTVTSRAATLHHHEPTSTRDERPRRGISPSAAATTARNRSPSHCSVSPTDVNRPSTTIKSSNAVCSPDTLRPRSPIDFERRSNEPVSRPVMCNSSYILEDHQNEDFYRSPRTNNFKDVERSMGHSSQEREDTRINKEHKSPTLPKGSNVDLDHIVNGEIIGRGSSPDLSCKSVAAPDILSPKGLSGSSHIKSPISRNRTQSPQLRTHPLLSYPDSPMSHSSENFEGSTKTQESHDDKQANLLATSVLPDTKTSPMPEKQSQYSPLRTSRSPKKLVSPKGRETLDQHNIDSIGRRRGSLSDRSGSQRRRVDQRSRNSKTSNRSHHSRRSVSHSRSSSNTSSDSSGRSGSRSPVRSNARSSTRSTQRSPPAHLVQKWRMRREILEQKRRAVPFDERSRGSLTLYSGSRSDSRSFSPARRRLRSSTSRSGSGSSSHKQRHVVGLRQHSPSPISPKSKKARTHSSNSSNPSKMPKSVLSVPTVKESIVEDPIGPDKIEKLPLTSDPKVTSVTEKQNTWTTSHWKSSDAPEHISDAANEPSTSTIPSGSVLERLRMATQGNVENTPSEDINGKQPEAIDVDIKSRDDVAKETVPTVLGAETTSAPFVEPEVVEFRSNVDKTAAQTKKPRGFRTSSSSSGSSYDSSSSSTSESSDSHSSRRRSTKSSRRGDYSESHSGGRGSYGRYTPRSRSRRSKSRSFSTYRSTALSSYSSSQMRRDRSWSRSRSGSYSRSSYRRSSRRTSDYSPVKRRGDRRRGRSPSSRSRSSRSRSSSSYR